MILQALPFWALKSATVSRDRRLVTVISLNIGRRLVRPRELVLVLKRLQAALMVLALPRTTDHSVARQRLVAKETREDLNGKGVMGSISSISGRVTRHPLDGGALDTAMGLLRLSTAGAIWLGPLALGTSLNGLLNLKGGDEALGVVIPVLVGLLAVMEASQ